MPEERWQPGYVILLWQANVGDPARIAHLRLALQRQLPALTLAFERPGCLVFSDPHQKRWRVTRSPCGNTLLIGYAFDAHRGDAPVTPFALGELAHADDATLLGRIWGSFVALRCAAATRIVRDPSGMTPCYLFQQDGITLVASALPRALLELLGKMPRIDLGRLANAIAAPLVPTFAGLLEDVVMVPAGCAVSCRAGGLGPMETLWPGAALLQAEHRGGDREAECQLRRAVTRACQAFTNGDASVAIELSGGLDSAIVLGAVASARTPPDIACFNLATVHPSGDERALARLAATRWQAGLVEIVAASSDLRFDTLLSGPQPCEPALFGLDSIIERASLGVAARVGAAMILTGQGGDAVFCNLPSPHIASDYARAVGLRALWSDVAYAAALRAHCSLWRVQAVMLRDRFLGSKTAMPSLPGMALGATARSLLDRVAPRHPWLAQAEHFPPGKRIQLEAIANCQHFNSPTWRGDALPLIHPLLALPAVEAALSIPTYVLAQGSGNRALARRAFADWLPTAILRRRGKGDASNYYRRAIVENLSFLRAHLLDGTLVAHGLLDPAPLDAALDEDRLLWSDASRLVAVYAGFEAWARHWGLG